jgi:prevent-host-death family protein
MDAVSTAEARKNLSEILSRAAYGKERVVVTRHGKGIAAIVPLEDLDALERVRRFVARKDVAEALADLEAGRSVPWQELRQELGV